ncbi:unnamed protein product [Adineta steineri]|uniref:Apple domain-containing protein n=1 Tax=Adineta steineri TaxID=433720 RepID=A0A813WBG7_9BILA|nr:unnamed protein product [Adineta steineri]
MMRQILLFFIHVLMANGCSITTQNQIQAADFDIFTGTDYVPSKSYNLIGNITDKSMYSVGECTRECLQYEMCETAIFYFTLQTCLLYREKNGLGTRVSVSGQTASMISMNNRNPAVTTCAASGQGITLHENQFIYSSNQSFAFGILTPKWGIFHVGAYGSIGSNYWQPAGNIAANFFFQLQGDGNVVLYQPSGGAAFRIGGQGAGAGAPYTFSVSNTGELVWLDRTNQIVYQRPP